MLQVFTAIIILADFGEEVEGKINVQLNCDLIEHKLNLMILLFTFREQNSLTISEIIIMSKTLFSTMHRLFPEAEVFSHKGIQDEIKKLMMNLFQAKIEEHIRAEKIL